MIVSFVFIRFGRACSSLILLILALGTMMGCDRPSLDSDKDQRSYAVGYALGQQLATVKDEVNPEAAAYGLKDGIKSEAKLGADLMTRRLQELQQKQNELATLVAANNLKKSLEYMTETAAKKGVRTLSPGILVEEIKPGAGAGRTLKDDDEITVSYVAKRSDGSVFDQTNDAKGVKVRFRDLQLPGLKKVIPKMPVGARWVVHLAPDQAYGPGTRPGIPSQSALIYEIQLIAVYPKK